MDDFCAAMEAIENEVVCTLWWVLHLLLGVLAEEYDI